MWIWDQSTQTYWQPTGQWAWIMAAWKYDTRQIQTIRDLMLAGF